jgi:predicted GNAT family acetyltransferase
MSSSLRITPTRFELHRDGHLAFLDYSLQNGVLNLLHTEVPPELRGGGVGSELVKSVLEWARGQQLKIQVLCPFVAAFLQRHPDYEDLLLRQNQNSAIDE